MTSLLISHNFNTVPITNINYFEFVGNYHVYISWVIWVVFGLHFLGVPLINMAIRFYVAILCVYKF